jgi:hypothetical protein
VDLYVRSPAFTQLPPCHARLPLNASPFADSFPESLCLDLGCRITPEGIEIRFGIRLLISGDKPHFANILLNAESDRIKCVAADIGSFPRRRPVPMIGELLPTANMFNNDHHRLIGEICAETVQNETRESTRSLSNKYVRNPLRAESQSVRCVPILYSFNCNSRVPEENHPTPCVTESLSRTTFASGGSIGVVIVTSCPFTSGASVLWKSRSNSPLNASIDSGVVARENRILY